jgi:hypothetical protein
MKSTVPSGSGYVGGSTAVDSKRVREIFDAARELSSATERSTFLDQACRGDPDLRQKIEALLGRIPEADAYFETAQFQEPLGVDSANTPAILAASGALLEGPSTVIGRYKLLE